MALIKRLESAGTRIDGIIRDGASSNRKMLKKFGISGDINETVNKIIHPTNDSRFFFFRCFTDVIR